MDGTVTLSGFTVIVVRHKAKKQSAKMNWWITQSEKAHTINITGIPVYARESCIRRIFESCGAIKEIKIQPVNETAGESHLPRYQLTKGYQQADVCFIKAVGVKAALTMKYDNNYVLLEEGTKLKPMTEVWTEDLQSSYNIDTTELAKNCTEYMEAYDKRKAKDEKGQRKLADEPDEDGWVTVTRNKFSRPPKAVKAHEMKKFKKKKDAKALVHFYKNQVTDSKMQRIRELKAKFEEDKKRIQEMRQQRKFKPY